MKLLDIITYPNSMLKKKTKLITNIDGKLHNLINDMAYTMHAANGIGLAAPQIGISKKLIVYNININNKRKSFTALMNPKIVDSSGKKILSENEGCLSIPDFRSNIVRIDQITVKGIDSNGKDLYIEAKGIVSIILQHEIDHLNGVLFIDHMSSLKRQLYKKKLNQLKMKR